MPSTLRLFLKGTPRNLPLLQSPMKFIQRPVIIMTILGMFGTTILCGTILNQAAHDDKPPVIHGNKKKNVSYNAFLDNTNKMFFLHMLC